jgi:hypothetical protein
LINNIIIKQDWERIIQNETRCKHGVWLWW